jgi:hypothetical protein
MRDRGAVIKQLVELTKRWNPLPRSQQLECARIGRELDAIGGKGLVIEAYNAAMLANPLPHVSVVIQDSWDAVGQLGSVTLCNYVNCGI